MARILGRGNDDDRSSDPSDEESNTDRWMAISEARETALLNKEPKSIPKRVGRMPFRSFTKFTKGGYTQNRSNTPPKSRTPDSAINAGRSASKEDGCATGHRSPRCRSPAPTVGPFSLLGVLDTASNGRSDRSGSPQSRYLEQ